MATVYEVMEHNLTHKIKERGVDTRLHRVGEAIALQYHWTDVVVAYPDGSVVLRHGGWWTKTTKERINRYLPSGYTLYQKNYTWYLATPNGTLPFNSGMRIPG